MYNKGHRTLLSCYERRCTVVIRMENSLGTIEISESYFSNLIGNAASSCFGVAGMANSNARQGIRAFLHRKNSYADQGVTVRKDGPGVSVDIHIIVTYGLNISAIVKSIVNKVRYTIEESAGFSVKKINVFVDGMKND